MVGGWASKSTLGMCGGLCLVFRLYRVNVPHTVWRCVERKGGG